MEEIKGLSDKKQFDINVVVVAKRTLFCGNCIEGYNRPITGGLRRCRRCKGTGLAK
jgi:hypothetical protein